MDWPGDKVEEFSARVIEATGAVLEPPLTVRVADPVLPSEVAVICTVPPDTPVTTPPTETLATVVLLLL